MKKRTTVVGVFDDYSAAVDAINEMRQLSFSDDQLGFLVRMYINRENSIDEPIPNEIAQGIIKRLLGTNHALLLPIQNANTLHTQLETASLVTDEEASDHSPAFTSLAHASIIKGGVIGGTMGAIASLQLPGIGLVIAGGVLAAILGSAESGGVVGGFLTIGIPEQKAHSYEQQFQAGNIILTIRANKEYQEAHEILHHHRALSIEVH